MLSKTRGIVIKYIKYKETSIIVQIFTENHGYRSFMVNGIRSPRAKRGIAYFQPFSILELDVYLKNNREIQRLSEWRYSEMLPDIHQNIKKVTVAMFLSEVLGKILIHEQESDHVGLFDFMVDSMKKLNTMDREIENFHMRFLLKMLPYLGLEVNNSQALLSSMELDNIASDKHLEAFLEGIMGTDYDEPVPASGKSRHQTLKLILQYYQHHTDQIGDIKSLKVLQQVFR